MNDYSVKLLYYYSFIGVSSTGYIALNSICSIFDRASLQAHAGGAVSNCNCNTTIALLFEKYNFGSIRGLVTPSPAFIKHTF